MILSSTYKQHHHFLHAVAFPAALNASQHLLHYSQEHILLNLIMVLVFKREFWMIKTWVFSDCYLFRAGPGCGWR